MSETPQEESQSGSLVTVVFGVIVMIGLMAYSVYYPFPSGEGLTGWDFVLFWLRELVGLVLVAVAAFAVFIHWLWGVAQRIIAKHSGKPQAQSKQPKDDH